MIFTRALLLFVVAVPGVFAAEPAKVPDAQAQTPAGQMPGQTPAGQIPGPAPGGQTPAQTPAAQVPAQPAMGRLFFSVPQRSALDEARTRPAAVTVTAPASKPLPPAPEYVQLNGVVRRSDGSTSVWLNNRMLEGKRTAEGLEVTDSRRARGAANVTVRIPQAGRSVDLRVGQRLDVTSGKVEERYQVAPPAAASEPSGDTAAGERPSASVRSPRRSPDRERRELTRDVEGLQIERAQPAAETKG